MHADFGLATERLRLRSYRQEDLDALAAMFADADHMRYYPSALTREQAQAWIDRQFERYATAGFGLWIAEARSDGAFVGTIGPTVQEVEGARLVELGWHVRPGLKGLGYAPEGGTAAREWAFANLDVPFLISLVRPENVPSARVAEKLGMYVWHEVDHKGLRHRVYRIDRLTPMAADAAGTP